MKKNNILCWIKAASIRAIKTMAQTALATIGTSSFIGNINWKMLASTTILSGLLSLLTSITGLPELKHSAASQMNSQNE